MKVSELWLREWVNPSMTREELGESLTMAGLEIESITPVAEQFTNVVVGQVLSIEKHPEADRLNVCSVDVGQSQPLQIVCGAKNVKVGMKVPAALEGAVLPNNMKIVKSDLRGVTSHGMLCSIVEIGLAEQGDGLMQLPANAVVGENIWDYLKLSDHVIDVSITPNRGDCLSVLGLAKEISAVTHSQLHLPNFSNIKNTINDTLTVHVEARKECPNYVGRVIRDVQADATTPMWMLERLRRAGVRCISPVVDVMNYVMLELGQPMHAFDLQKIAGNITVRLAKTNEELTLLDGQTVKLDPSTLVVADEKNPLAIAGVMGGLDSGVTLLTTDIFLESAYFTPGSIAKTGRLYHLGSDSSYRFERGIDPTLQVTAIERATELLLEIVGGKPGPVIEVTQQTFLPQSGQIHLRKSRISKILGFTLSDADIEKIFHALGFTTQTKADGWEVTVPARRSDVVLEIDLIEELVRLYGYNNLPKDHQSLAFMQLHPRPENKLTLSQLKTTLVDLGFNEVVTYSFIDKKQQKLFDPNTEAKELVNPITAEMNVMRTTLWPGLLNTLLYNQNRQQTQARLFEVGLRFIMQNGQLVQQRVVSGLIHGDIAPEQWGIKNRKVDFFDLKGNLEDVIKLTFSTDEFKFNPCQHPALHPGQAAEIQRKGQVMGYIGAIHPNIVQLLDLQGPVFVFEMQLDDLELARLPHFTEISKFPEIRRDIAILVDDTVPVRRIQDTIKEVTGELLRGVTVFDVYQGKGIADRQKSVALGLTLQHTSRTLRDEEVTELMERIMVSLKDQFAAVLR